MAKFINMDLASMIIEVDDGLLVYFKDWCYIMDDPQEVEELKFVLRHQVENNNWWCLGFGGRKEGEVT